MTKAFFKNLALQLLYKKCALHFEKKMDPYELVVFIMAECR